MSDAWSRHKLRLRATAAITWFASGFALVLLIAAVAPIAFGYRAYVVQSGSMDPAIKTGDMVVTEPIEPGEAEAGDIITFRDPEGSDALITHRARLVQERGSQVSFVTRGDANNNVERWSVPAGGEIGRVSYRLPKLGSILNRFDDGVPPGGPDRRAGDPAAGDRAAEDLAAGGRPVRGGRIVKRRSTLTRAAVVLFLLSLLAAISVASEATFSSFSATSPNPANQVQAASDFVAPSASRSVIAKVSGGTPGYIRQGVSYYVYAEVTDTGSPASGISTVTANTSAFDTGTTAAALTAGSYTIGGQSYNYRTGTLTANGTISQGTHNYSLDLADAGGNSRTQTGFSVIVDNTAPSAADVQATNGASIVGRPEQNDTITFTYSEPVDPNTVLAGWTGAQTDVVIRINHNIAAAGGNDQLIVANSANSAVLPITGTTPHLNLGRTDYVGANRTFGVTGTKSKMTMSGNSITIVLGTQSGAGTTAAANGTMTWTPSTTPTDPAGNSVSSAARTETGSGDREF